MQRIGRWTQYRHMRLAWWAMTIALLCSLAVGNPVLALGLLVFWVALSAAAAHWPCPHCNQRVGVIPSRFFALWLPFGGWCLACGARLFGRKTRMDGP